MIGDRLSCADYVNVDIPNANFKEYIETVEVTNVFVFDFNGEIIHPAVYHPDCWHVNKVASMSELQFPEMGDNTTPKGYEVLGTVP